MQGQSCQTKTTGAIGDGAHVPLYPPLLVLSWMHWLVAGGSLRCIETEKEEKREKEGPWALRTWRGVSDNRPHGMECAVRTRRRRCHHTGPKEFLHRGDGVLTPTGEVHQLLTQKSISESVRGIGGFIKQNPRSTHLGVWVLEGKVHYGLELKVSMWS